DIVARSSYAGYSMPSNHSANMFALATFIGKSVPKTWIPLTLIASTVAYSRIYNGVHYPSDVVVGAFIGYLISSLGFVLIRRLRL
ncbi:MAG: phosphatase PAP2 family protein, partial [Bdellovibrionaceae bacterium]|nr:phosphatase PAP2 family protein [Pseudobdellovibrionaceae bacterium]